MMQGIDLSKYQRQVDWEKVKAAGKSFAIIRAGYGRYLSQQDPMFKTHINGAASVGLPVGAYWFSYALSAAEAEAEAEVCLKILASYREKITLPIFFDQEYVPAIIGLGNKTRTDCCLAFMKKIQAEGYRTGVYCSYDWLMNKLERERLTNWPLWVAQYGPKCSYRGENLVAWQYSGSGAVEGVSGAVDLDEGYSGLLPERETGWRKEGGYWYYDLNGVPQKERWIKDKGWWYWLGEDGRMATGWLLWKGKAYWLNIKAAEGVPEGACIITDKDGAVLEAK